MGNRIQATAQDSPGGFDEQLAVLRKAAGFTQTELATKVGISQRKVACYESPQATPPANLLLAIAATPGMSIDDLFGCAPKLRLAKHKGDSRLRRSLLAEEKLGVAGKRQLLQLFDAFIERGQSRHKAQSRA